MSSRSPRANQPALIALNDAEAMKLIASVDHGRIIFTRNALPAVRLVNHLIDDGQVILRTRLNQALTKAVRPIPNAGVVVAYEVDQLDLQEHTGWSVVVTGMATTINDPEQLTRYERLHPWVNPASDNVLAITPQIISGIRISANQRT
ncbi:pyridoxamine 5'-phosphate oxidase family protein [Mycobacterium sp. PDNC021]|uniref:pyridoxamine 5'-phosphate oxidase family protein n=1 Tax=Mycobacterium sp. PDNC021 TaxID=3391399 RepID=UPI003AAE651C